MTTERKKQIEDRIEAARRQLRGFGWPEEKIEKFVKSMRREYADPASAERKRV